MMPRWLYLWPLHFVQIGYAIFAVIFLVARKPSHGRTKKAARRSVPAMFIQGLGFVLAWGIRRKPLTPFLSVIDWRAQYFLAALIVVVMIASLIFVAAAVRTLGQQWSLEARVLENHELIQRGPYRIVRHPIYTGMFGLLVAASLARGHWIGLVLGSLVYYFGTIMRIRAEEKLLRDQFGDAYEDYARKVPAFIPFGTDTRDRVRKKS